MPSLMAIISANADPMRRELNAVRRMASETGVDIQRGIGGSGHTGSSGSIRETLVLMREISRGNWTRVPGSLSILMSRMGILQLLFKNTASAESILAATHEKEAQAASIAAIASTRKAAASQAALYAAGGETEANLEAAAADEVKAAADIVATKTAQAKALASADAATAAAAEGTAATMALGPIGWLVVGLIAVGTAAFFTVRHFLKLSEESRNLREILDFTKIKFSEQAEALKAAADEAQNFDDWLKRLAESQHDLGDATDEALHSMREQARYERELAQKKGASKKDLAAMDIAEAKKELDFVTAALKQKQSEMATDRQSAIDAEKNANNPQLAGQIKSAGEHGKEAGALVDAVMAKMNNAKISSVGIDERGDYTMQVRSANADDKFTVKVGEKEFNVSLNEAKAMFDTITKEETRLAAVQRELTNFANAKKKLTEKDNESIKKLTKERDALNTDLGLKQKYLPQLADAERGKMMHGPVNSLQQIGAYIAPAVAQLDVSRKQLHHLARIDSKLDKIGASHGFDQSGGLKGGKF